MRISFPTKQFHYKSTDLQNPSNKMTIWKMGRKNGKLDFFFGAPKIHILGVRDHFMGPTNWR
jgi:hypothetical protein